MAVLLAGIALVLAGCTSGWRAPLENRSSEPTKRSESRPPRPGATHYRVRRGDTLYAIAWRSSIDFRDIARWNGIRKPYTIYAGQVLRLRPPARRVTVKPDSRARSSADKAGRARVSRQAATVPAKPTRQASQPRAPAKPTGTGAALRWRWPADGRVVSSYKSGDPLRKGLKLSGKPGDPIHAAEAGKVVYSGSGLIGYGRLIIVKHNDKYLSAYGHNRKLLVKQGQQVSKGQKIAELGTANDGKPLLHFEIRRDGKPVNPRALLPRR